MKQASCFGVAWEEAAITLRVHLAKMSRPNLSFFLRLNDPVVQKLMVDQQKPWEQPFVDRRTFKGQRALCIALLIAKHRLQEALAPGDFQIAKTSSNDTWVKLLAQALAQGHRPKWLIELTDLLGWGRLVRGSSLPNEEGTEIHSVFYIRPAEFPIANINFYNVDAGKNNELLGDSLLEFAKKLEFNHWGNSILEGDPQTTTPDQITFPQQHHADHILRKSEEMIFRDLQTSTLNRNEFLIRIQGSRGVGKTTIINCVMRNLEEASIPTLLTDFKALEGTAGNSAKTLFTQLCREFREKLSLAPPANNKPDGLDYRAFVDFLKQSVFPAIQRNKSHLVWLIDHSHKVLDARNTYSAYRDFFKLVRYCFDTRTASDVRRFRILLTHRQLPSWASKDIGSPWEVGLFQEVRDFTKDELSELLRSRNCETDAKTVEYLFELTGGIPLVCYDVLRTIGVACQLDISSIRKLESQVLSGEGELGRHLERIRDFVFKTPELHTATRNLVKGVSKITAEAFEELRRYGIVIGSNEDDAFLRCALYKKYFLAELRTHRS